MLPTLSLDALNHSVEINSAASLRQYRSPFHWVPRNVFDLKKMAEAEAVTGPLPESSPKAPLCLRGSRFGSVGFPCPVARRHMAMRVQIPYDIGLHLEAFGPTSRSRSSGPCHEQRPDRHEGRRDDRRENRREDHCEDRREDRRGDHTMTERDRSDNDHRHCS